MISPSRQRWRQSKSFSRRSSRKNVRQNVRQNVTTKFPLRYDKILRQNLRQNYLPTPVRHPGILVRKIGAFWARLVTAFWIWSGIFRAFGQAFGRAFQKQNFKNLSGIWSVIWSCTMAWRKNHEWHLRFSVPTAWLSLLLVLVCLFTDPTAVLLHQ